MNKYERGRDWKFRAKKPVRFYDNNVICYDYMRAACIVGGNIAGSNARVYRTMILLILSDSGHNRNTYNQLLIMCVDFRINISELDKYLLYHAVYGHDKTLHIEHYNLILYIYMPPYIVHKILLHNVVLLL